MASGKDLAIREIEGLPPSLLQEVLDFVRFIKTTIAPGGLETALLSEAVLSRDWLRPEEDEARRDW